MNKEIKYPKFPYVVGWSITNKCNLQCVHCNMDSGCAWEDELITSECKSVIDELADNKVKAILMTGGEPLLRSDFFEVCDYAFQKGINVSVTTNGTLITDKLVNEQLWKFQSVRISLDSHIREKHDSWRKSEGTFDKAVSAISKMSQRGINVAVSTCVSHNNIEEIEKMADFLVSLGVSRWCLPLLSPDGRGKNIKSLSLQPDEIKAFVYKLDDIQKKYTDFEIGIDIPYVVLCGDFRINGMKGNCPAGVSELTIFANGDVSPCFAMVTSTGNVRKSLLEDIWKNGELFHGFRNRNLLKGKCKICSHLDECGGGCRANPYIINGDYLGEDTVCWR